MMPHTHLQLRSAQHRQTRISARFCGTIQFLWGAWNCMASKGVQLSSSSCFWCSILFRNKFFVSCSHFREGAAGGGGVNIITICFMLFILQTFELICTIWAHHVGFACWAHGQAGILFIPPPTGETRLVSCAGSMCMLNGNGSVLKATRSLFICCGLVCFWFRPGTRGSSGSRRLLCVFFSIIFRVRMPT